MALAPSAMTAADVSAAGGNVTLINSSRSGIIEITSTSRVYTRLATAPIVAGTILQGATLKVQAQLSKIAPNNAGWAWRCGFTQGLNTVIIAQNDINASLLSAFVRSTILLASDLKSAATMDLNSLGLNTIATGAYTADTGASATGRANDGARAPASIMFASYSSPPTVETILIDFKQDCTFFVDLAAQNGDKVELVNAALEMLPSLGSPNSKRVLVYGDSLPEGTGSTAVSGAAMDPTSQLRRIRTGWPMTSKGLGGQPTSTLADGIHTGQQITERVLADATAKKAKLIVWAGTNDFDAHGGDGPGWWSAIKPGLDRIIAYRGGTSDLMFNTLHPRASWAVGDANYTALQYVNGQMISAYGVIVCDLFTALATNAGKVPAASMFDDIHLTNAGYATVAATWDAKITSLGWL